MRIILRDSLTGLYYDGHQTWCAEVSGAVDFDSFETATSLALAEEMKTVNVVLRYEEPTCELALPLGLWRAITPHPPRNGSRA